MTLEQFKARYRGRMLLHLTEAWACRKAAPSDLGFLVDQHSAQLDRLLEAMFKDLAQPQPKEAKSA